MWECDISRSEDKERWQHEGYVHYQQWQAFPQHIADAIQDVCDNGRANGVQFVVYFWDPVTDLSHVMNEENIQTVTADQQVYEVDVANRTQKNLRTQAIREIRREAVT